MNSIWLSRHANEAQSEAPKSEDVADAVVADVGPDPAASRAGPNQNPPPSRPPLARNTSQPPPPVPMPQQQQQQQQQQQPQQQQQQQQQASSMTVQQATDSLSLMQLRRMVADFRQVDPVAYDFEYADTGPHGEEIDEWFSYLVWQYIRLNGIQRTFEWQWQEEYQARKGWAEASDRLKKRFVEDAVKEIEVGDPSERAEGVAKIVYLVLGRWGDTATSTPVGDGKKCAASEPQLEAIDDGARWIARVGGLEVVWRALRNKFDMFWSDTPQMQHSQLQMSQEELQNLMTVLYISIQACINKPEEMADARKKLLSLNPGLVNFMLVAASKLRWDEGNLLPQSQIFLILWKSVLLTFGGSKEISQAKKETSERVENSNDKDVITASPLDYHAFRQEITSKYPAYIPPQPAIPLEDENTSLLPPLGHQAPRNMANSGVFSTPTSAQNGGASILHQPVHIATPAPSPPPSPGVGGKGGKKQNYQTNQNFPFMYPPLDATSNTAGGKGPSGVQGMLVSRRWEGSDIPASILEASELFSNRVRMTRATRQLWDEREAFLKFERGWDPDDDEEADEADPDVDEISLDELTLEEREEIAKLKRECREVTTAPVKLIDYGPHESDVSDEVKRQLVAVENFYREALPHLQSLVIVLLKAILQNVTALIAQAQASQQHPGAQGRGPNANGQPNPRPQEATANGAEATEPSIDEIDAARTREITSKAVTGTILLLLKWFKISHVLKFEYFTQLLIDSNYIPLVLKLFAHQDIQQVVDSKTDRIENSFFRFCDLRSKSKGGLPPGSPILKADPTLIDEDSEDEALPPPIKLRRSPPPPTSMSPEDVESGKNDAQAGATSAQGRPEVDELGYPVNPLPKEPISDYSRRNFFSLINYLRIMQKICKNKAHRNLLLVSYKSSNILRKSLKVPQTELRLYTLKLFKNQVPYCGRKWRQGNMRVITAVYLHCRPELRDEWLAGGDVDAEVDAALPLEQALRSLTHWFNVRRYPDMLAEGQGIKSAKEERDFFAREVEKVDMWDEEGEWMDMNE